MDIKISNILKTYEQYNLGETKPKTAKYKQVQAKEQFALSSMAKDYQTVLKELSKTPDVREDRIAEITKKIKQGQYNVTADDVAASILEHDSLFDIKG